VLLVVFTLISCYFDNVAVGAGIALTLAAGRISIVGGWKGFSRQSFLVTWLKFATWRRIPRKIGPDPAVISLAFGVYLVSHIFGFFKLTDCPFLFPVDLAGIP
jgi:hypothetical protein